MENKSQKEEEVTVNISWMIFLGLKGTLSGLEQDTAQGNPFECKDKM